MHGARLIHRQGKGLAAARRADGAHHVGHHRAAPAADFDKPRRGRAALICATQGGCVPQFGHIAALQLDQAELQIANPVGAVLNDPVDAEFQLFGFRGQLLHLRLDRVDPRQNRTPARSGRGARGAQLALELLQFDEEHRQFLPDVGQRLGLLRGGFGLGGGRRERWGQFGPISV